MHPYVCVCVCVPCMYSAEREGTILARALGIDARQPVLIFHSPPPRKTVRAVGMEARRRVLQWDEAAFASVLLRLIGSSVT